MPRTSAHARSAAPAAHAASRRAMPGASRAGDPREPSREKPFVFRGVDPDEPPLDAYAFAGLWLALGAVLLQVRLYSWLNLICVLATLANTRQSAVDRKVLGSQLIMAALTFLSTHAGAGAMIFPALARRAQEMTKAL